jgi:hypothetical protein
MATITVSGSPRTRTLAIYKGHDAFALGLKRRWVRLSLLLPALLQVVLEPAIVGIALSLFSHDASLTYFIIYTAVTCFGIRNGRINLEHEISQLMRHGIVVSGRSAYFLAQVFFASILTTVQTTILFAFVFISDSGLPGRWPLAVAAIVLLGWISSLGWLFLSLFFRSQRLLANLVPGLVVLQMLSSGYIVPTRDMPPIDLLISTLTPAFFTERIIDLSLISGETIKGDLMMRHPVAYMNINSLYRSITGERLKIGTTRNFNDWFIYSFSALFGWLCTLLFCGVAVCRVRRMAKERSIVTRLTKRKYD